MPHLWHAFSLFSCFGHGFFNASVLDKEVFKFCKKTFHHLIGLVYQSKSNI